MTPDDRARISELLQDPSLSYRAIGRELGISDWTVRKIAREINKDTRQMKHRRSGPEQPSPDEVSPLVGWLVFSGFVALVALSIWAGARSAPSLDSTDFPYSFHTNPPTERTNDET